MIIFENCRLPSNWVWLCVVAYAFAPVLVYLNRQTLSMPLWWWNQRSGRHGILSSSCSFLFWSFRSIYLCVCFCCRKRWRNPHIEWCASIGHNWCTWCVFMYLIACQMVVYRVWAEKNLIPFSIAKRILFVFFLFIYFFF